MPRAALPPPRLGPVWVAVAAVVVSAGAVGIGGALAPAETRGPGGGARTCASCPPGPRPAQPGEIAAVVADSDGDLLQPMPAALGDAAVTASEPAPTVRPAAVPPATAPPTARSTPHPTTTTITAARPAGGPRPGTPTPAPTLAATPARTSPPAPSTAQQPTGQPTTATVWDRIAECESGGDWAHPETPDGYSGGLLFSAAAWARYGGTSYAPIAAQATKAQQIVVAERVHTERGDYSAWPGCGAGR